MKIKLGAIAMVLFLLIAACGGDDDDSAAETTTTTAAPETTTTTTAPPETTTTTTAPTTTTTTAPPETTTTTEAPMLDLLLWADEKRAEAFSSLVEPFAEATGVNLDIQILEFGDINPQVQVAGPAGEGPDLFVGAHDWTGALVANGIVDPMNLGALESNFLPDVLPGFSIDGTLYAMPYAHEAISLFYNADLVPEPPTAIEDFAGVCDAAGTEHCIAWQGGGDATDAYHMFPWVTALGGYLFEFDPATGFNPQNVGLDTEETIRSMSALGEYSANNVVTATNGDNAKLLFTDGQAAFYISGPWAVGDLDEKEGLNWGVTTLPTVEGGQMTPFMGGQGIYLSSFSENKLLAQTFLVDFVATEETMERLFNAEFRVPVWTSLLDKLADDPLVQTFRFSAESGNPMPNIPEMGTVWGPLGDNIREVANGDLGAEEAMTNAATAIRDAIAGG